jgi:hypothetical protein
LEGGSRKERGVGQEFLFLSILPNWISTKFFHSSRFFPTRDFSQKIIFYVIGKNFSVETNEKQLLYLEKC